MTATTLYDLSQTKFFESYSRWDEQKGRYETWDEAVERVMNMHRVKYSTVMTDELAEAINFAETQYKERRLLGAQRCLQFGGDQIIKHNMKLYNCTSSYCDRPEFFGEIFYILLCGAGAGFSVQKHHIAKLPKIKTPTKKGKEHIIEDSIEGWATALDILLSSYFVGGGKHPQYEGHRVYFDFGNIRPEGSLISGGFKAPGPDGLRRSLDKIDMLLKKLTIDTKDEVVMRPIHAYDIVMHIADAVLSGGVRRSATICLFTPEDTEMVEAKIGKWEGDNPQRGRSNNSAVFVRSETTKEQFKKIMDSTKQYGEPGFVFVESTEHLYNPCAEIGMFPQLDGKSGWQGCNLTEINGVACDTKKKFLDACRASAIIGTLQAGYTDFKFIGDVSKEIFEREALIGCSVTGWMNNPKILFNKENLHEGVDVIKETNKNIAKLIGINPASRTTCVKPSGNASVLLGTCSGIDADHAPRYIRNVRLKLSNPVVKKLQEMNPYMFEKQIGAIDEEDVVASFPIEAPKGSMYKGEMTAIKSLEKVKFVQEHWVTRGTNEELNADKGLRHNVSNTIIVDNFDNIAEFLYLNKESFSGVSFMPQDGDLVYEQSPFTAVPSLQEFTDKYDTAGIFVSGLIVDALHNFESLWIACATVHGKGDNIKLDDEKTVMKRNWVDRFKKFSKNYFEDEQTNKEQALLKTEQALKECHLMHRFLKIQKYYQPMNWNDLSLSQQQEATDIDTMGASACQGGGCEVV